jgi:two-component system, NtrC family, sensor kinase
MNPTVIPVPYAPTLLIVDDTPANVGLLVDYLEEHHFRTVVAQDGEEALQRAQFAQPDLILLDVMMPGIDGFETCRRLKAIDSLRDIPVIFMTALTYTSDKVTAFNVGGVDYVTKPFQIEEVIARINTHLDLRRMQKQLATQNLQLQQEIAVREQAEQSLSDNYEKLKTSNRRLEEMYQQLVQAEKMASIGQLAAGVAHEINNPIAFISSNLGALRQYVDGLLQLIDIYERTDDALNQHPVLQGEIRRAREKLDLAFVRADLASLLEESIGGVQRVRSIVQDLRDFSHVGESEWQMVSVHTGIDSTLNIIAGEIREKAQVAKEYGLVPDIECIPAQLNQVFLNLLLNAVQSIDRDGLITVRTGQEGDSIWVEIADNGCGIPRNNLARIFDPFFTTKPLGKATGLGLSLSYGIASQHGGRIEVRSEEGEGSVFRVCLPVRRK